MAIGCCGTVFEAITHIACDLRSYDKPAALGLVDYARAQGWVEGCGYWALFNFVRDEY